MLIWLEPSLVILCAEFAGCRQSTRTLAKFFPTLVRPEVVLTSRFKRFDRRLSVLTEAQTKTTIYRVVLTDRAAINDEQLLEIENRASEVDVVAKFMTTADFKRIQHLPLGEVQVDTRICGVNILDELHSVAWFNLIIYAGQTLSDHSMMRTRSITIAQEVEWSGVIDLSGYAELKELRCDLDVRLILEHRLDRLEAMGRVDADKPIASRDVHLKSRAVGGLRVFDAASIDKLTLTLSEASEIKIAVDSFCQLRVLSIGGIGGSLHLSSQCTHRIYSISLRNVQLESLSELIQVQTLTIRAATRFPKQLSTNHQAHLKQVIVDSPVFRSTTMFQAIVAHQERESHQIPKSDGLGEDV